MHRIPALVLSLLLALTAKAADLSEPGVMLRAGNWNGDIGTYTVPMSLANLKPAQWPNEGWRQVTISPDRIVVSEISAPARQRPKFLALIAAQVTAFDSDSTSGASTNMTADGRTENVLYLRFPGTRLRTGEIQPYRFKNGTSQLAPKLDYRYELNLGQQAFAFTVRNGLTAQSGAKHGDGAQYTIEYDGKAFEYSLPEYGWDSRVTAIADIDGDGKPDFLIAVGGNNSTHEYLLLSSLARPGRNPPSAALHASGC